MDTEVTWKMFNDEITKYLSPIDLLNTPKFTYLNQTNEKITFNNDKELKLAFEFAQSLGDNIFVIFAETIVPDIENIVIDKKEETPIPKIESEQPKNSRILHHLARRVLKGLPRCAIQIEKKIGKEQTIQPLLPQLNKVITDFCNDKKLQNDVDHATQTLPKFLSKLQGCNHSRRMKRFNMIHNKFITKNNFQSVENQPKIEEKQSKVEHGAVCDNCNEKITGIRYKCLQCFDFDFCDVCEELNYKEKLHDENHFFAKIIKPTLVTPFPPFFPRNCFPLIPHFCIPKANPKIFQTNNVNILPHLNNCQNENEEKKISCNDEQMKNDIFPGRCRKFLQLRHKINQLEKELSEIKNNLIGGQKEIEESVPRLYDNIIINEEILPSEFPEHRMNEIILSAAEEDCYTQLQEMGYDVSVSFVIDNNADLDLILEKLM